MRRYKMVTEPKMERDAAIHAATTPPEYLFTGSQS